MSVRVFCRVSGHPCYAAALSMVESPARRAGGNISNLLFVTLASLFGVVSGVSALALFRGGTPCLSVAQARVELGELQQQQEVETSFELRNDSSVDILIEKIETGCSCTGTVVSDRNIQPGNSTHLPVTFKVGARRDQITSSIDVLYRVSGEKHSKSLGLELSGYVQPHYDIRPQDRVKFDARHNADQEISIEPVAPFDNLPVEILDAYSSHRAFTVERLDQTHIRISFDPNKWDEDVVRPAVVIETNSRFEPIHEVPIYVVSKTPNLE